MSDDSEIRPSLALRQAIDRVRAGLTADAEQIVADAAGRAASRHGPESHEAAVAFGELGSLLLHLGQPDRAAEAFLTACAGPMPAEKPAARDRLTFLSYLGTALARAGRHDDAEGVLRQGVEARRAFYGSHHPGFAFGLEPLAEFYLEVGRYEDALTAAEAAIHILWDESHPRVTSLLALRARIIKTAGTPDPLFDGLDAMPDELVADLAANVFALAGAVEPRPLRAILGDLYPLVAGRLGEGHPATMNTLSLIANLERDLGDHDTRIKAIRRVIDTHQRHGRDDDVLHALLGLALAQSDAGRFDEAEATYDEALARANATGTPALLAQVLRNYGLFSAERGQPGAAEQYLGLAVEAADRAGENELSGRVRVALGVFLQQQTRLAESAETLRDGLSRLAPGHPDAITGRSYLLAAAPPPPTPPWGAAESAGLLHDFVVPRLPEGLVSNLAVRPVNGQFEIDVDLARPVSDEESASLRRILNDALVEFRGRAGGAG